jgi:hypothetical protein
MRCRIVGQRNAGVDPDIEDFDERMPHGLAKENGQIRPLDQAFRLPEVLVAVQHLASVLQEGRENANIDVGFGIHLENLDLTRASPYTRRRTR